MKLVIFTRNTARIFDNVEDYNEVLGWPNAFLNPDLNKVDKTPPHYWTIKDGRIVAMNWIQRFVKNRLIKQNGMNLKLERLEQSEIALLVDKKYEVMAIGSVVSLAVNLLGLIYALGRSL